MKFSFLCDAHRQELNTNITKAIRFWQEGFDSGQFFNEQGLWVEAIPQAGCAFEIAEILVTNKDIDAAVAYEWFYASTQLLADAFNNLGYKDEAYEAMGLAVERFDRELALSQVNQKLVMDYLNKLHWSEHFVSSYSNSMKDVDCSSEVSVH
jgi:hypothetical protein